MKLCADKTQTLAKDAYERLQDISCEFSHLYEPLDLHTGLTDEDPTLLSSYSGLKNVYELHNGFRLNKSFKFGNQYEKDDQNSFNPSRTSLASRDMRRTKSSSNLLSTSSIPQEDYKK